MKRVAFVVLTGIALSLLRPPPGAAQGVSLIGHWVHCEPEKGCLKFAFQPNGDVIEQYPLASTTITAYGTYRQGANTLRIKWSRVSPKRICGQAVGGDNANASCLHTGQRNMKGSLQFTGFNALTWSFPAGPPLQLVRVEE